MVLDARLRRLAGGVSAKHAALSFARTPPRGGEGAEVLPSEEGEVEAIIEAMFLMAAVDGEIAEDEVAQLAASIQAIFEITGGDREMNLDAKLTELGALLDRDGWKGRLDTLAPRLGSGEARAFAFRLAAGVALVDDHVAHAEAAAIDALAAALGLPPDESQQILVDVQRALFA